MLFVTLTLIRWTTGAAMPSAAVRSLASADRQIESTCKSWLGSGNYYTGNTVERYEQIIRKYGDSYRAELGIAKGCILRGRYGVARAALLKARPSNERKTLLNDVEERLKVERLLQPSLARNVKILAVTKVPESPGRWGALTAQANFDSDAGYWSHEHSRVWLLEIRNGRMKTANSLSTKQEWEARAGSIVVVRLGDQPALCADLELNSADTESNAISFYRVKPKLKSVAGFLSKTEPWQADPGHGHFAVAITPTWKVFWADVYEWREGRFVFANNRHPSIYRWDLENAMYGADPIGDLDYGGWMHKAAAHANRGNWLAARLDLIEAERALQEYMGRGSGGGYYGDSKVNLQEVRQRLRWIARHEYRHMLLYRPYDWDLLVPPYKLGHAGDDP